MNYQTTAATTSGAAANGYFYFRATWTIPPTPPRREPPDDGLAGACAILGVPPDVDPDDLRAAYRIRLKEAHPDLGGSDEAVRGVIAAYQRLGGR